MHKAIGIGLLLAVGTSVPANAQALRFQHLTTADGLSDNAITCVYEDQAGYIWIGTERGLNKYDGSTVQQITGTETSIAAVLEDRSGIFWIATKDRGLMRLDRNTGHLRTFDRSDTLARSMASEKLTALYDLNDTTLLIGSREVTLMFMDKRTFNFTYWVDSTSISPSRAAAHPPHAHGWCHALVPLDDDRLWIGLLNMYLSFIVDRRTDAITHYANVRREGSETLTCAALLGDTLYAGGWQTGLDLVAIQDMSPAPTLLNTPSRILPTEDEVVAITKWRDDGLLFGIRQRGLVHIDGRSQRTRITRMRSDPASLSSDRVRCLVRDRRGTIWVGTSNGLDLHVPDTWRFSVQDIHNQAHAERADVYFHNVEAEGAGGVRMFTSDGFFVQDTPGGDIRNHPFSLGGRPLQPTVRAADHDGSILIGTEYGIGREASNGSIVPAIVPRQGLDVFDLGRMYQVRGIQADTLQGRNVFVVAAMGYGVKVLDATTHELIGRAMPSVAWAVNSYSMVHDMVRDASGRYWVGSANGLYSWHASEGLLIGDQHGKMAPNTGSITLAGEDVRSMQLVGGTVWGLARSGSVLRVRDGTVERFTSPDHLIADMYGMAADRNGRFWITTENGLLRFDTTSNMFLHVPVNDGQRFRKLGGAIAMLSDGRMACCVDNALITFHPEHFETLPALPMAFYTGATAAGLDLLIVNGKVQLSYRSSVIDIGVSAVAFGHPQALLLDYRLEGVEEEWRTIPLRDGIRYAGVPVGAHRLLVKVRDAFGRIGPEQVLLTISVAAPFWLTWWFYAIVALVLSAGTYAWYRFRLRQALKLQAVRNRIASDLHDEVGSSLSSITIGSQLATSVSPAENEQLRKLLERIGETSSQSLRSMSDIVWAIDPKNDEGEALVKRMRRIASELLESQGIDVSFTVGDGVEELKLPMNARKEIVLIFKEAVHNVSKYSGASTVQVSLHRRNGSLAVSVKDDGRGFEPSLHPDGHGLGSMKRRATSLGSQLVLTSAPGLGTLVGVEVDLTRIRD